MIKSKAHIHKNDTIFMPDHGIEDNLAPGIYINFKVPSMAIGYVEIGKTVKWKSTSIK